MGARARELALRTSTPSSEWDPPFAGGSSAASSTCRPGCLDRHIPRSGSGATRSPTAGRVGQRTPAHHHRRPVRRESPQVRQRLGRGLGVGRASQVAIYASDDPQAARRHAGVHAHRRPHSVVFGPGSPRLSRWSTASATPVRRGHRTADGAAAEGRSSGLRSAWTCRDGNARGRSVVVVERAAGTCAGWSGRDHWYHDIMAGASLTGSARRAMDAGPALRLLCTSGHHGQARSCTCGRLPDVSGAATSTSSTSSPTRTSAGAPPTVGWVTGRSTIVLGHAANGAASVITRGAPTPGGPSGGSVRTCGVTQLYGARHPRYHGVGRREPGGIRPPPARRRQISDKQHRTKMNKPFIVRNKTRTIKILLEQSTRAVLRRRRRQDRRRRAASGCSAG